MTQDQWDVVLDALGLAADRLRDDPTWRPHEDYASSFPTREDYAATIAAAHNEAERAASVARG